MPERPPDFATIFASVIFADRSTPFTMSTIASAATVTEVRASISTPVRSAVRTVERIATWSASSARSTSHPWTPIVWARGSRSGTRFAAWMPATRATARTSPFGTVPSRRAVMTRGEQSTRQTAVASRTVGVFAVTSTM